MRVECRRMIMLHFGSKKAFLGMAFIALVGYLPNAIGEATFIRDGKAGFVVSHIEYALAEGGAEITGACPRGMALHMEERFALTEQGKRREGESEEEYAERLSKGARALSEAPNGENLCMSPEAGKPDPHFHTVRATDIPVFGIDLDGESSSTEGTAEPGSCAHNDFRGVDGRSGVDNQFYRVVGCTRAFQPSGQANGFATEMLTGSWGILISLSDVDDIRNDDYVEVGFFANDDPIQLSPSREPLAYATYILDPDSSFQAVARGRITDGVLTTEPTDVQFRNVTNSMYLIRPLRDARLRVTLSGDGAINGYLAGYTPVEALYDYQFGYRTGRDRTGKLAPLELRRGSANGAARVLGYTCDGVYHALYEHADGHPNPETGQCTSISTQYRIEAIPAFVVDSTTKQHPEW